MHRSLQAVIAAALLLAAPSAFAQSALDKPLDHRLEAPAALAPSSPPPVVTDPEWDTAPTPDAPSEYETRRDRVVFNCGFLPDGQLSDCQTVTPHPFDADRARIITGRGRLSARTVAGASPDARVVFEVSVPRLYMPPVITNPPVMIPPTRGR